MKEFAELSQGAQFTRLRRLALRGLQAFPVTPRSLEPLRHIENTTFKVRADEGDFVIRIHRPGYMTEAEIRSELLWLEAIRRDTDIQVPEPVHARNGDLLVYADATGVPEPRTCVLFRWLEGSFLRKVLKPWQFCEVGRATAILHSQSERFSPPEGFIRRSWGSAGMMQTSVEESLSIGNGLVSPQNSERFLRAEAKINEMISGLQSGYGLIHADLHHGNYFFHNGQVRIIDFDDCGFGYHLYDLAVTLSAISHRPNYDELRAALLEGYRDNRRLPAGHEALLSTFIASRRLDMMSWILRRSDHPLLRASLPNWIATCGEQMAEFLAD